MPLIGGYVHYDRDRETDGHHPSAATPDRSRCPLCVASRPATAADPGTRPLRVTSITPLSGIGFEDWDAFGVKAANVAVLRTLGFPPGTVPDGFAIPFYFYDEFMKHNGFYTRIETMMEDHAFRTNFDAQVDSLKETTQSYQGRGNPPVDHLGDRYNE